MARGKYAKKAEKTRDVNQLASELEGARHEIDRLKNALETEKESNARRDATRVEQITRLLSDNENLTGDAVRKAEDQIAALRAKLDEVSDDRDDLDKTHKKVFRACLAVVQRAGGLDFTRALEAIISEMENRGIRIDKGGRSRFTDDQRVIDALEAKARRG